MSGEIGRKCCSWDPISPKHAPIEFTLPKVEYTSIGGYADHMVSLTNALADRDIRSERWTGTNPWPYESVKSAEDT